MTEQQTKSGARTPRFGGVDGLRGVSAIMVVFHHLATNALLPAFPILLNSHLFVLVFFVVSGLVITFSGERAPAFSIGDFMWRRAARVWPLHATVLAFMMLFHFATWLSSDLPALSYFVGDHSLDSFVASLMLIQTMGFYPDVVWNGPSWSISVEFYTYLVFAIIFVALGPRARAGYLVMLLLSIAAICICGGIAMVPYQLRFFYCALGFFSGALLLKPILNDPFRNFGDAATTVLQVALVSAFVLCLQFYKSAPTQIFVAVAVLAVLLVAAVASNAGLLPRLMSARPAKLLGALSYSVYLCHIPLLNVFFRVQDVLVGALGFPSQLVEMVFVPAFLAALIGLSWLLYSWVEIPAQRALLNLQRRQLMPKRSPS